MKVDSGGGGVFDLSSGKVFFSVYAETEDEYCDSVDVCRKCGCRKSGIRLEFNTVTIIEAFDASTMVQVEDTVLIEKMRTAILEYMRELAGFTCFDCID